VSDYEAYLFGLFFPISQMIFHLSWLFILKIFEDISMIGADISKHLGVVIAEMPFLELLLEGAGVFEYFVGKLSYCIQLNGVVTIVEIVDGFEVFLVEELLKLRGYYFFRF